MAKQPDVRSLEAEYAGRDSGLERANSDLAVATQLLIEQAPDGVFVADLEGRYTSVNAAACDMLGYTREELLRLSVAELLPDEDLTRLSNARSAQLAGGTEFGEWKLRRKDGTFVPVELSAKILPDGRWQVREITARKRLEAEQALVAEAGIAFSASLEYDETLANIGALCVRDLADFCILDVLDDHGVLRRKVTSRDAAIRTILDRVEELCGAEDSYPIAMLLSAREPRLIENLGERAADLRLLCPEALIAAPLVIRGRAIGVLTLIATSSRRYSAADLRLLRELSDRAALALENARLYRVAGRALRAREEVFGIVAHDLRSPLGSMLLQLRMLEHAGDDADRRQVATDSIGRAARRMNRLIEDLLDVARLESGNLGVERCATSPEPVLSEAITSLRDRAAQAGVNLALRAPPDLPPISADRERLLQVFENLIGNAIKFTPRGGEISVEARPSTHEIAFTISDNGNGIPDSDLPHLFEAFWQGKKNGRRGAGLGLAIVKGIVKAHRGEMSVTSEEGRGTTFSFTIPRVAKKSRER